MPTSPESIQPDHAPIVGNEMGSGVHRVCFVGPMIGRTPGRVTTQGEVLVDHFRAEGWPVCETSPHPSRPVRLLDTIACLLRWRRHIDVVVLSVFSGPAFLMADITSALTRALRIPTVMWLHGGNLPEFQAAHPRWVERVLGRAGEVVAPSPFLIEVGVAATGRATIVPNLIDVGALPHRVRIAVAPELLWMRTFHPVYNPGLAVRALQRIRSRHPEARLTMAGQEKGLTAEVRSEVESLGLHDAVELPGFLDPTSKAAAFEGHDIYLHTNHIDNAPVSVLEAAAAGLPIVATAVGGIPHLLQHEETALLVPDDDDQAMADAVDRLLTEPGLAERLSTNARQLALGSSWPAVRSKWVHILDRVASGS